MNHLNESYPHAGALNEVVELKTLKQLRTTTAQKVFFRVSAQEIKLFCQYASEIARIPHLELYFSGNCKSLDIKVFSKLPHLKKVDFSCLPVETLNLIFPHLSQMESLTLAHYRWNELPDAFHYLKHLKKLDLQNNQFQAFPEMLLDFKHLESLNLSYNPIQRLPNEISELSQLTELYLVSCNLIELPQTIGKLKALKRLEISNNFLAKLPQSLTQCIDLERIILSDNSVCAERLDGLRGTIPELEAMPVPYQLDIAHTCQLLMPLPKLQQLDFADLVITEWPPEYYQFKNLKQIRFSNDLWCVQSEFKTGEVQRYPTKLNIEGTMYEKFNLENPPDFQTFLRHALSDYPLQASFVTTFHYLETLQISNLDYVETLPDIFDQLPHLQNLTITGCLELTLLPSSIYKSKSIKTLSVNRNGFYLDTMQLKSLSQLQSLQLDMESTTDLERLSELTELTFLNINAASDRYTLPESFKKLKKLTHFGFRGFPKLDLTQAMAQLPYLENIVMGSDNELQNIELPKTTRHLYWDAPTSISTVFHWIETLPQLETIEIQRLIDIDIPKNIVLLNRLKQFCLTRHFNHLNVPLEWVFLEHSKMAKRETWQGFEMLELATARVQHMALATEKLQMLAFGLFAGLTEDVKSLLSNPFESFEDWTNAIFYVLGKPTWLEMEPLEIFFKTNGIQTISKWTEATHILICPENDEDDFLWAAILNSDKKLVLEDFLKQKALKIHTPFLMDSDNEALTQQITQLLASTEVDNVGLIVEMMVNGGANRTLLSYLTVIQLKHPDAEVRESAHILFKKYASVALQAHVQGYLQQTRAFEYYSDPIPLSLYYHSDIDFFDATMAERMIALHHSNTYYQREHTHFTLQGYAWATIHTGLSRMFFLEKIALYGTQNFDYQHFIQLISTLSIKTIELRGLTESIDLTPLWTNPHLESLYLSSAAKGLYLRFPPILTAPLKYLKLEGFAYSDLQYATICLAQIEIVHFEQAPDKNRYGAWSSMSYCDDGLPF